MTRRLGRVFLPALCLAAAGAFAALGVWQIERREWKLDLIERVDARLAADPVPLPPRQTWKALDPRAIEYLKVRARGRFLHSRETLIDALTERGAGYWVLTPLRTAEGTVLVNRGFVPSQHSAQASREDSLTDGNVEVVGLIRLTEPEGRFLRPNQPFKDRWYSRDVNAIAAARGLEAVAPFFIDAGPAPNPGGYPIGGLTVIRFRNTHLVYALTWFGLAGLCLVGLAIVMRTKAREDRTLGA